MGFDLSSFINEYFTYPMRYPGSYPPYNIYNTAVFVAVALVSALVLHHLLTRRLKITIGGRFYFAVLPYLLFGGIFRVFEDAHILPREVVVGGVSLFPFITPGIYIACFVIFGACFAVAGALSRNRENALPLFGKIGWALSAFAFAVLLFSRQVMHPLFGAAILALALACAALFLFLDRRVFKARSSGSELATVFGQCLDGAATFVGLSLAGYGEQHVVGNAIISSSGPIGFFGLKACFAFAAIWLSRDSKGGPDAARTYFLLLLTLFGLGPGTRDLVRILFGV